MKARRDRRTKAVRVREQAVGYGQKNTDAHGQTRTHWTHHVGRAATVGACALLLAVTACAAPLPMASAADSNAISVAGIPLGGTIEAVKTALAAKGMAVSGQGVAVLEMAALAPAAGLGKSGTLHFHDGNLYKVKLFYTQGEERGHEVYTELKQFFAATYGEPEVGMGDDAATIESVEWARVLGGKVSIGLLWQADGRVTALSYVFVPVYDKMVESLSRP